MSPYHCSRCDEAGHRAPDCPSAKARICRVELIVDADRFAGELFPAGEVLLYRWLSKARSWDRIGQGLFRDGKITGVQGGSTQDPRVFEAIERTLEAFIF